MKSEIKITFNENDKLFLAEHPSIGIFAYGKTRDESLNELDRKLIKYKNFLKENDIDINSIHQKKDKIINKKNFLNFFNDFIRQFTIYFLSLLLTIYILLMVASANFNYFSDRIVEFLKIDEKLIIERISRKIHHMAKDENKISQELEKKIIEDLRMIRLKYIKYFNAILKD
jgi:hypothetical protein